jgi:hypothetical protein
MERIVSFYYFYHRYYRLEPPVLQDLPPEVAMQRLATLGMDKLECVRRDELEQVTSD